MGVNYPWLVVLVIVDSVVIVESFFWGLISYQLGLIVNFVLVLLSRMLDLPRKRKRKELQRPTEEVQEGLANCVEVL